MDQRKYQSAIGSLMYLSVCTRLDIEYAVNSLARFKTNPTKDDSMDSLKTPFTPFEMNSETWHSLHKGRIKKLVSVTLTQTELGTWSIANQLQVIFSAHAVVGQFPGKVKKQRCVALSKAESEYVNCYVKHCSRILHGLAEKVNR